MGKTDDIDGQKVKNVMIMIELENGKALVARPTEIGKIDELVTLKDLQRMLSNEEGDDDTKFLSPIVWAEDLRDCARRWIKELRKYSNSDDRRYLKKADYPSKNMEDFVSFCFYEDRDEQITDNLIAWINHIFNLLEDK